MKHTEECDVLLIGAGIMSATLGAMLTQLDHSLKIKIFERMNDCAKESSQSLNNAGTGHSGFCELNYDIEKAIKVCESFERSKQFWAYLKKHGSISNNFIHTVPHISFVEGKENVEFLKKRFLEFREICLFEDMEFTEDVKTLTEWMPLVMKDRNPSIPVAATRMKRGTDVNFGLLTKELMSHLVHSGTQVAYCEEVVSLKQDKKTKLWAVETKNMVLGTKTITIAKFVFIGAGGAALNLLEKSDIPEAEGYGGFPVSGQWLICDKADIVDKHQVKVYGKPGIGAPPMSVPHLDTRYINGKKVLLFGPYAGFSTKFLKNGSWLDFFKSLRPSNLMIVLESGLRNFGLVKYLTNEVFKTKNGKFDTLLSYYPSANKKDWKLATAGQRVQVIKKVKGKAIIEFGTEIISSCDCTIAGLTGASPGASTSVKIMLDLIDDCFKDKPYYADWMYKMNKMIPQHGLLICPLHKDRDFFRQIELDTMLTLNLNVI